ncbi:hypothetical protein CU013_0320 [Enterococcus faecium]|nr:hypothetical protein [Enterococcus faecium]
MIFFPVYKLISLYHESANTLCLILFKKNKAIVSRIAFLHKLFLQKKTAMNAALLFSILL